MRLIKALSTIFLLGSMAQASLIRQQTRQLANKTPIDEVGGFEIGNGRVVKFDSQEEGFSFYHHERLETVRFDKKIFLLPRKSSFKEQGIQISQMTIDSSQVSKLVGKWLLSGKWKFDTYSGRHALRADKTNKFGEVVQSEIRVFKNEDELMIIHFNAQDSIVNSQDLELVLKTLTVKN